MVAYSQTLGKYHPISLLHGPNEVIDKTLTIQVDKVMGFLISDDLEATVRDRHIQEQMLMTNELINPRVGSKDPGLVMKLNFAKALQCVNWEFLYSLLDQYGFGLKRTAWIRTCLATLHYSIAINGSPQGTSTSSREVHQVMLCLKCSQSLLWSHCLIWS